MVWCEGELLWKYLGSSRADDDELDDELDDEDDDDELLIHSLE